MNAQATAIRREKIASVKRDILLVSLLVVVCHRLRMLKQSPTKYPGTFVHLSKIGIDLLHN